MATPNSRTPSDFPPIDNWEGPARSRLASLTRIPASSSGGHVDLPAATIAEAIRTAVARSTPAEALQGVIAMAVQTGPCDAASITMRGAGKTVDTVASSDAKVEQADLLQYELGEGPSLDAVWTNGVFIVPNLVADGRWPHWAPQAAELGIGASLAVHLFTDAALGSLNLYSLAPRGFTESDIENAKVIAAQASVVLAYARTQQNLWQAIDVRNLIGQAQGILMQRYGLTAPKAFAVLRRYSQHHNIKLTVLAEQLTTTGQLPHLDNSPHPGNLPIDE